MLAVEDISVAFGDRLVLSQVSFALERGEMVGLVGPSGCGKSVLLKVIAGVLKAFRGRVRFLDGNKDETSVAVGFSFQEGALFDSLSVIENVAFPLMLTTDIQNSAASKKEDKIGKIGFEEAMERAYAILTEVGLKNAYNKLIGELSGGMRRRVGIARALVGHPEIVLLDDPTGGLDPVSASVIMELICTLHEHYHPTVILVSHDIRRLLPSVEKILAIFQGELVCSERVEDLGEKAPQEVIQFLATRYDFSIKSADVHRV